VPEELWYGARRSPVHDTYRDVFRHGDTMARSWASAVAAGRRCQPDLAEGARVQQLLDAATRSAAQGGGLVDVAP
jgi:predicted dehydrogenase